jgi:hypothetical protein
MDALWRNKVVRFYTQQNKAVSYWKVEMNSCSLRVYWVCFVQLPFESTISQSRRTKCLSVQLTVLCCTVQKGFPTVTFNYDAIVEETKKTKRSLRFAVQDGLIEGKRGPDTIMMTSPDRLLVSNTFRTRVALSSSPITWEKRKKKSSLSPECEIDSAKETVKKKVRCSRRVERIVVPIDTLFWPAFWWHPSRTRYRHFRAPDCMYIQLSRMVFWVHRVDWQNENSKAFSTCRYDSQSIKLTGHTLWLCSLVISFSFFVNKDLSLKKNV